LLLDTIVSIEPYGEESTRDIQNKEEDFFLEEPNYICEDFIVHNSGVIISDVDLDDELPTVKTSDGEFIAGFQESGGCTDLLQAGFIKYDILGVNNLDIVKGVLKNIDEDIDYLNLPLEDPITYNVLDKNVDGLFQIGSDLFKKLIRKTRPRNLLELSDLIALGRPGPLKVKADNEYEEYKKLKPKNIPKFIEDVLKDSHYVLLYQEQVMKIFMNLGFSEREADEIRSLLKKIQKLKLGKVTEEEKKKLIELGLIKK